MVFSQFLRGYYSNKGEGPVQETQEDAGLLSQILCAFRGQNFRKKKHFRQEKN
jgi:hypothetical protein